MTYKEQPIEFSVRDIQLRGLSFTPCSETAVKATIVALHGWLDNAESFRRIAPPLAAQGFRVIALDLAGQGLSDMRPLQGSYHLWDDAVDIMAIADQLELSTFYLLGHSRGAMIATQLAAAFPDRISKLCVLDGFLPLPVSIDETVEQFQKFVLGFQKRKTSRSFASWNNAIEIRAKAARMNEESVELLAKRGLFECNHSRSNNAVTQHNASEKSWQWRVDERLKIASAIKMTEEHNQQWLAQLASTETPSQIILAEQGLSQLSIFKDYQNQFPNFQWITLAGGHHQHMQSEAAEVAKHCIAFYSH